MVEEITMAMLRSMHRTGFQFGFLTIMILLLGLAMFPATSTFAGAEKGPRCSDLIDNDGDGLVDGDDPDCGGASPTNPYPLLIWKDGSGNVLGQDVANTYWGRFYATVMSDKGFIFHLLPRGAGAFAIGTFGKSVNLFYTGANCSGDVFVDENFFEPGAIYRANYDNQKYFSDFLVEPVLVDTLSQSGDGFCSGWIASDYYYPLYPNDPAITGIDNVPYLTGPFSREPMN